MIQRFAQTRPGTARLILGALAALIVVCWVYRPRPAPVSNGDGIGGDLALYRAIVERVHTGENYYDAAGAELRARSFGTKSVLNWRTPTLAVLLGKLPTLMWGRAILAVLGTVALGLGIRVLALENLRWLAAAGGLVLFGAVFGCFVGDAIFFSELWAGVMILLSVCAYEAGAPVAGIAVAMVALGFRELALPYVVVCIFIAIARHRWRELTVGALLLLIYAGYFAIHAHEVSRHIRTDDLAYSSGWLTFAGIPFLLQTIRQNAFLLVAPAWVTSIAAPAILLGAVSKRDEHGWRIGAAVLVYTLLFLVVGKPFNGYWGLLTGPLFAFALVWGVLAVYDVWCAAWRRGSSLVTESTLADDRAATMQ